MRKYLILLMWLSCLSVATRGQTLDDADLSELLQPKQAQAFDYWFDDDTGHLQTVNSLSGTYAFDVSSLPNGLHMLHCQVKGANGEIYGTDSRLFLTMNDTESLPDATLAGAKLRYWFDEDAGSLKDASGVSGTYAVDVSALSDGLHTLHYMLVGTDGSAYSTRADMFIKMEEMLSDPTAVTTVAAQRVTYWFDDDAGNKQTANSLSGIYTLDVTALDDGLHLLHYYVEGEDGLPYGLTSRMFLKDEGQFAVHEPNRITKYTYWVNNSVMETVTLDQPVKPYSLISLLPLQTMPIRSSNFHFQVDDGVPTIYAKNTFNIRFYDSEDHFVDNFMDDERTFIDYGVKQLVTGAELIESGVGAVTEKPAENTIKWYYLTAEPGDSLEFRLDRAATIQLFAPSGKEVYRASGAASVRWGGCHARETGIYYLALHDVAATMGNDISIGYNHIDKYAVLRQDVAVVGNGGCSTITFEGNGFRDLYAVELYDALGNTIQHAYIGHEGDATTSVVFDFTDAAIGQYSALFHFTDEDKVFPELITVEEAREIEIVINVINSSSYIDGNPTDFDVKITNKGNMTAYTTPVEIRVAADKIQDVKISGFLNVSMISESIQDGSVDEEAIKLLEEYSKNADHRSQFIIQEEDGREQGLLNALLTIPPNSTKIINVSLKGVGVNGVSLNAYADKHVNPISISGERVRSNSSLNREYWCCIKDGIKCSADLIAKGLNMVTPPGLSCAISFTTTGLETWFDVWCTDGANMSERFKNYLSSQGHSLANRLLGDLIGCMTKNLGTKLKDLRNQRNEAAALENLDEVIRITKEMEDTRQVLQGNLNMIYNGLTGSLSIVDCYRAFKRILSDCSLDPVGAGGFAMPFVSKDPNDIYGYTAESGSKAVMDGQTDVYYTIEFENDPEFATASAHDIYLTDVLDATKFDLSTYKPTRVKIGNKSADLSGEKNFVTTIDMRPEIYAIAQVEGSYDEQTGVANWHISSLDPMTMEPTENLLDGILPVNTDGLGIGEVSFDISLKPGLSHGTEINNQASIIFDNNDPIVTPVWTNVMDCVKPESLVSDVVLADNGMAEVSVSATDELSGPWRYDVYVQYGQGSAWFKAAENVDIDKAATVSVYQGIDHGFCTIVTDAAGNVEQKTMAREFSLSVPYILGDVNGDGKVTVTDVLLIMDKAQGKSPEYFVEEAADLNGDGAVTLADAIKALAMILDHD